MRGGTKWFESPMKLYQLSTETSLWALVLTSRCFCRRMFFVSGPWTPVFKDNGCAFLYISACTLGTGTVLEMHGMALLHLTGPQRSRLSLCSTAQTWEVQVETSFARGTLLLSGAFSKQVKCFKGSTQKQRAANPLVELQQGHPTRQRKEKL